MPILNNGQKESIRSGDSPNARLVDASTYIVGERPVYGSTGRTKVELKGKGKFECTFS
jgi:hypothetical protein